MKVVARSGLIALALLLPAASSRADTTVYYRAGVWDAFSGSGEGSVPVCGVGTTNPNDGRAFSLRVTLGSDNVVFEAKKPSWNIPDGTMLQVVMQVGLDPPWTLQGTGGNQVVTWALDRSAMHSFDMQFRRDTSMTLSFPSGNEAPWTISLTGSTAISNTWGRCVTDLMQRAAAQQRPAQPAQPTQPFGQQPTQPVAPPATQPAPPAKSP